MKIRTRKLIGSFGMLLWMIVFALVAVAIIAQFPRPPFLVELALYAFLGFVWIYPLKPLFIWMGKAPDRYEQPDKNRP